eukprot:6377906-Alexandrium_andersonii.AAC.1
MNLGATGLDRFDSRLGSIDTRCTCHRVPPCSGAPRFRLCGPLRSSLASGPGQISVVPGALQSSTEPVWGTPELSDPSNCEI